MLGAAINDTTLMPVSAPSGMAVTGTRVLVTQTNGQVKMYQGGVGTTLTIATANGLPSPSFNNGGGERGLLGIAVDPNDANKVYLHYSADAGGGLVVNQVTSYTLSGTTLTPVADVYTSAGTSSSNFNHFGGGMTFGADGFLYVAVGDHTVPTLTMQGYVQRVDVTNNTSSQYASGLRNPFALAVQPGTGLMFINDVGTNIFEEINAVPAGPGGLNFGWPCKEGSSGAGPLSGDPGCPGGTFTDPLYQYAYGSDNRRAITGGTFYNPATPAALITNIGEYLFTDFLNGKIYSLNFSGVPAATEIYQRPQALNSRMVALATAANGDVYYLDGNSGTLGVLSAVPEPSAILLTACGIGSMLYFRVRRRKPGV
jgi:glucose/arabinose dehydrogenase